MLHPRCHNDELLSTARSFATCALGVARVNWWKTWTCAFLLPANGLWCHKFMCLLVFLFVCFDLGRNPPNSEDCPRCWTFLTLRSGRRFSMSALMNVASGSLWQRGPPTSSENQLGRQNVENFLSIFLFVCFVCWKLENLFLALCYPSFFTGSRMFWTPNCWVVPLISRICPDINTPKRMSGSRDGESLRVSGVASFWIVWRSGKCVWTRASIQIYILYRDNFWKYSIYIYIYIYIFEYSDTHIHDRNSAPPLRQVHGQLIFWMLLPWSWKVRSKPCRRLEKFSSAFCCSVTLLPFPCFFFGMGKSSAFSFGKTYFGFAWCVPDIRGPRAYIFVLHESECLISRIAGFKPCETDHFWREGAASVSAMPARHIDSHVEKKRDTCWPNDWCTIWKRRHS